MFGPMVNLELDFRFRINDLLGAYSGPRINLELGFNFRSDDFYGA